jgi:Fe-S cluster assembly scaffold protein SufB
VTWTKEHGRDELYDKYAVVKTEHLTKSQDHVLQDIREFDAYDRIGGPEDDELVFVLRPEYDEAACTALLHYAAAIQYDYPTMAAQLRERVEKIITTNRGQG